jgi:tetratricopeptide (TPR) repeat protein
MLYLLAALVLLLLPQELPQADVDPAIKAVVDRFFETQQSEDAAGYLALWSAKAQRPTAEQLKYIFDAGDDKFTDIVITRASVTGDQARVRVSATRARTDPRLKRADGTPRVMNTLLRVAIALTREDGAWKIVREGEPPDELAAAILETDDPAARKALLEAEPDLATPRLVDAISRRADALAQISQVKAAQAIYERALEIARAIGDRKAEGKVMQNIANALYYQRDFPAALSFYERRLAIEREMGNDDGVASALLGVGTIYYSTYDYSAALDVYRQALAIQERQNDESLIGTTLISTGNVLYLQGDFDGAIADYTRAEALKRKTNDLGGAVTALEGLGRVYFAQGDFAAALGAFNASLEEWRKRNVPARIATALQSVGDVHFRLRNIEQARAAFMESRAAFERTKDASSAGRVLQSVALNELVAGQFPAGEKAYMDSIGLCTPAKDSECIAHAQVGLAFALAAQEKFDDAITWYGKSLISFNDLNMDDASARARIGLAEAYSGKKEYAKALEEAMNARRTGVALASDDLLWRALVAQARAERKLGQPVQALGSARAALLAVRRLSAAALDRPDQAVPDDTSTAFATVAILQAEAGDAAAAFATTEELRAHALRISLAPSERDIARGMTDAERDEERRLATSLTSLIVKRDRQKDLPKPDKTLIEKLDAEIKDATARRNAWRETLYARLPELRVWRGLAPPATIDDLRLLLNATDRALLEFVVDEHDVLVVAASGATPGEASVQITAHVVPIERQALAASIGRALDGRALTSIDGWRTGSTELFQLLPASVVERARAAKSIVIVPDDVLWRVPFEAMPMESRYLADSANISYALSVAAVVRPPAASSSGAAGPIIAIGAPDLPESLVAMLKSTAPTWTIRPAEAAAAELERIGGDATAAQAVLLKGPRATIAELQAAAAGGADESHSPGPLHIAAPFRVNTGGPLFSPVLLTPTGSPEVRTASESGSADSGSLSADQTAAAGKPPASAVFEIRDLFRAPPLASAVMFSDPATLSKRDAAAAARIVNWAWRASGATTVIFRRWGGDDPTATEIIAHYYNALRAGKSPADALHTARAAVRATESGRAPAAWAGWLVFGS